LTGKKREGVKIMAKAILPKPALLLTQMQTMIAALTKYADSFVPTAPTKTDLETCVTELTGAIQVQSQAAGAAEKATSDLYDTRDKAVDLSRRMRDAIYSYFGKTDPRIVEFGLDTLKTRKSTKNENDSTTSTPEA
jgi:hypothetical protein